MIPFPRVGETIVFAGDWHGNANFATRVMTHLELKNVKPDAVIHTGDFGYNFSDEYLDTVNGLAASLGTVVMFVDGNHENFDWLLQQPVSRDGVRRLRERVWHLPRNFRWTWQGLKFGALGGAVSVDQHHRMRGVSWWPQEQITMPELVSAAMLGPVDVLVTHDCPAGVEIPDLEDGELYFPRNLLKESDEHRTRLAGAVQMMRPTWLWHGHYHVRHTGRLDYQDGSGCVVTGLDCDANSIRKNIDVVTVSDLVIHKQLGMV